MSQSDNTAATAADEAPLVNRLARETSPYLLQHKDNPVAWQPWGPEALETARRLDKPVLLSVGYAACHWCHVMAHESFENGAIAERMNELFVNIKLDREERPDLDAVYQQALALLGQPGGWPLTIFLTPDGEPFWGGTYFPPEPRFGRPGFAEVLRRVAEVYAKDPDAVAKNVGTLKEALGKLARNKPAGAIALEDAERVAARLVREVDPFEGGIGEAPKFPQPALLKLFWRAWLRGKAEPYRNAVELTLSKMCQGGIYDHLGGGFARYAVDSRWLVPHFEKMLYDNAQLIDLLTWAWQGGGNPLFEARVRETVTWVLREMIAQDETGAPTGAFAGSLDADSEGEEGRFYVWSEAEIDALLGQDAALFKEAYDVTQVGNWEGKTILNRSRKPELRATQEEAVLAEARAILFAVRERRVRPGWDDKVLADWNGLMIAALARAAQVFGEPSWLGAAERAFAFVVEKMTEGGHLKHAWRLGRPNHPATLEDYANLSDAALALFEATGTESYLTQAEAWVELLNRHYLDRDSGGYFLAADDVDDLIQRGKPVQDTATPAGNATIVGVLARLHYLTGKDAYRTQAEATIAAFSGELTENFFGLATLINSAEFLARALQAVIVGNRGAGDTIALLQALHGHSLPDLVLQVIAPGESLPEGHPAKGKGQADGKATAYLCRGAACSLPITDPEELGQALTG